MSSEAEVRRLALALPEAYEDTHRGQPSFRVKTRIFAMLRRRSSGKSPGLIVKLGSDDQHNMLCAYPLVVTPWIHYPQHGWTQVWRDDADDQLCALILRLAWLHVAPKRLHALLQEKGGP